MIMFPHMPGHPFPHTPVPAPKPVEPTDTRYATEIS